MNQSLALRRTLGAIAHLDDPEPPWSDLLQGVQQVIGGDSATFILLEGSGELLSFQQVDVSPAAEREYAQHFCAHDILIPPTLGAAPGSWFDTHELFSPSFLSRNLYYADFMCRHGVHQMLACVIDQGSQRRGGLTVQRSTAVPDARRLLDSMPIRRLILALRQGLARRDQRAQLWLGGAESALAAFGEAVVLVTPAGAVVHASARAQEFFDTGRSLRQHHQRLWHPDAKTRDALRAGLRLAAQSRQRVCLFIPDRLGGQERVELVRAAPQLSLTEEVLVQLCVRRHPSPTAPSIDRLRSAFDITQAEARVLAALMSGQSAKQHAGVQGVSVHTVRSQIGSLMAKMGCTRQVDLVRAAISAA